MADRRCNTLYLNTLHTFMEPPADCTVHCRQLRSASHPNPTISLKELGPWLIRWCNMFPGIQSPISDIISPDEVLCLVSWCNRGIFLYPVVVKKHFTDLLDICLAHPALNKDVTFLPQAIIKDLYSFIFLW